MIKPLLLILLSITFTLTLQNPHSFGLQTIEGEPLELLHLETKAFTEGPYVQIQYTIIYKNPFNSSVQTKFVFPQTENAVFHKFEATIQNQTITAKIVENSNEETESTQRINKSQSFLSIPAQEIVHVIFSMIQPLEIIVTKFYELKLPAFINSSLPSLQQWNIQIELKSNYSFAILSNPTHRFPPELSEQPFPYNPSSKIYKAFWNVTVASNQDFIVYFGPDDFQDSQIILAKHPSTNDYILLLNLRPDMEYVTAEEAQAMLENPDINGLLEIKLKAGYTDLEHHCLIFIDRSDSMKGSPLETLKRTLKTILNECEGFNILSFGTDFEFYNPGDLRDPYVFQEAIKWVDTLEANMGGSDLLKVLRYASSDYDGGDYPPLANRIILTDGDISYPDRVVEHIGFKDYVVGIGENSKDIIKSMAKVVGFQTEFAMDNEDFRENTLNMVANLRGVERFFCFDFSVKCHDDQNRVVFKKELISDYFSPSSDSEILNEWIHLSNITNLKSCSVRTQWHEVSSDAHSEEDILIQTSQFENAQVTDIWHKVASDEKIKMLTQSLKKGRVCDLENAKSEIINLSLQEQVLSPFTYLVPQIKDGTNLFILHSPEYFDLSRWNRPSYMDQTNFTIPENYIPLDSLQDIQESLNKAPDSDEDYSLDIVEQNLIQELNESDGCQKDSLPLLGRLMKEFKEMIRGFFSFLVSGLLYICALFFLICIYETHSRLKKILS